MAASPQGRFGTFAGVFTPTVLTILGIILYLRIGWVVGQAGLLGAMTIIILSNLVSLMTALSLSAVATNMHVRTGGTYYMIARTLGLEIGGAIGIPLYFSQAISVAFYIIGFTEAFISVFPAFDAQTVSLVMALAFGFLAFMGADFALRIHFVTLAIIAASLLSFFIGGWGSWVTPKLFASSATSVSFWQVFAIFFPAVTGIMVGVSLSGDLRDPGKSIPLGTISAVVLTGLVYLATALWMGVHADPASLVSDNMIMAKIARWPFLIILGVWASTLSSALGSVLAAPRTLQAISFDRAIPRVFGARLGSVTEPRLAVLVTTSITVAVILMGNLNFVAPIITMFFLNTYGMINLTAGIERLVGNPSFRPRFKVPWVVSLIGAIACYGTMFLINAKATVVAIILSYGIFVLLERRSLSQRWGDIRSGIWFALSRFGLLRLEARPWHVKNWRPNIVVFLGLPHSREQLMEVGSWLGSGRGIVTFFHLLVGELDELAHRGLRTVSTRHSQEYLSERGVSAFSECSIVRDFHEGVLNIIQAHGIAGLEPNTALIGWGKDLEVQKAQLVLMSKLVALGKSTLFLHYDDKRGFGKMKQIDVWWRGRDRNAELMLLLAHIIRQSRPWEGTKIRVLRWVESEEARTGTEVHIARFLEAVRVEAKPVVVVKSSPEELFDDVLRQNSMATDLVFLGLRVPEPDAMERHATQVNSLLQASKSALLVRSGETEDILDPDSMV
jgi:amino acid transporter